MEALHRRLRWRATSSSPSEGPSTNCPTTTVRENECVAPNAESVLTKEGGSMVRETVLGLAAAGLALTALVGCAATRYPTIRVGGPRVAHVRRAPGPGRRATTRNRLMLQRLVRAFDSPAHVRHLWSWGLCGGFARRIAPSATLTFHRVGHGDAYASVACGGFSVRRSLNGIAWAGRDRAKARFRAVKRVFRRICPHKQCRKVGATDGRAPQRSRIPSSHAACARLRLVSRRVILPLVSLGPRQRCRPAG